MCSKLESKVTSIPQSKILVVGGAFLPDIGVKLHCTLEQSSQLIKPSLKLSGSDNQPACVFFLQHFGFQVVAQRTISLGSIFEKVVGKEPGHHLVEIMEQVVSVACRQVSFIVRKPVANAPMTVECMWLFYHDSLQLTAVEYAGDDPSMFFHPRA